MCIKQKTTCGKVTAQLNNLGKHIPGQRTVCVCRQLGHFVLFEEDCPKLGRTKLVEISICRQWLRFESVDPLLRLELVSEILNLSIVLYQTLETLDTTQHQTY